jgi:hypothetical protein
MLELRPCCECCGTSLPPDRRGARICSFECTYCERCAIEVLAGTCPNCGGELVARPTRPTALLAKYPASTVRRVKDQPCAPAPEGASG